MKNIMIVSLPNSSHLALSIAKQLDIPMASIELRDFPDGETYVRIISDVKDKIVILVCSLDHPNNKSLPLMFIAKTLKEFGAIQILLIAPYLAYMRQDKRFKPGEALTSALFADYLSKWIDGLITIDPHLHRYKHLSELYSLPILSALHATKCIAKWINENINSPFIIGPDEESSQWVTEVAALVKAPYVIIKKERLGDNKVNITVPEIKSLDKTLILVDDIISTGCSMLAAIQQLMIRGHQKPVCIGVHALFDSKTNDNLLLAGARDILTTNTIFHPSNKIDISDILVEELKNLLL